MLEKLFIIEDNADNTWHIAYGDPIQGNILEIDEETARQLIEAKK